jgi:hypothetical protein
MSSALASRIRARSEGGLRVGSETLSFLPGHVPPRWQRFTDDQVAAAAGLIRQLHDATRDLASALSGEVICHHDPARTPSSATVTVVVGRAELLASGHSR